MQDTEVEPEFVLIVPVVPNHGRILSAELDGDIVRCDLTAHPSVAASFSAAGPPTIAPVRLLRDRPAEPA
jgi:hypothetical protein